jgi:hypothetical protein
VLVRSTCVTGEMDLDRKASTWTRPVAASSIRILLPPVTPPIASPREPLRAAAAPRHRPPFRDRRHSPLADAPDWVHHHAHDAGNLAGGRTGRGDRFYSSRL